MMRMMKQPQEMFMKGICLIAALAAALPIHAASAQDEVPPSANHPTVVPGGFRAEVLLGYDHDGFEEGLVYGGRLGYDFRVGRSVLLGLDAELNGVTTDQELLPIFGNPAMTVGDGPDFYIGPRATFSLSRQFSLYGGAGYTRARHGYFRLVTPGVFGPIEAAHFTDDGYRLSFGGQFNISRRSFLGAEYRYSDYERGFQREQVVGTLGFRF